MKYFLVFCSIVFLCGCNSSTVSNLLDTAEECLHADPSKSISILEKIDKNHLKSSKHRAKYVLLKAMAFDNAGINNWDLEALYPAIKYYTKHPSPKDKLRMYYLYGKMYSRLDSINSAMKCFIMGAKWGYKSNDYITLAKMLNHKATLHYNSNEYDQCLANHRGASDLFLKANRTDDYLNSQIHVLYRLIAKGDSVQCNELLQQTKLFSNPEIIKHYPGQYYRAKIRYETAFHPHNVKNTIGQYIESTQPHKISWLAIAYAWLQLQEYEKGITAIEKHKKYHPKANLTAEYYIITSRLYKNNGNYQKALEAFNEYHNCKIEKYRLNSKTIEQIYQLQFSIADAKKQQLYFLCIAAAVVIILLLLLLHIHNNLKIRNFLYTQLENEKEHLTELLSTYNELNPATIQVISERLNLLNTFITAQITNNEALDKKAYNELNLIIGNQKKFIESTIHSFEISYPKFIPYLKERHLTNNEISYCCLLAIGLKGKEIGTYINVRRHYSTSSTIRKKLGMDSHETNLSLKIKELLKESSANTNTAIR